VQIAQGGGCGGWICCEGPRWLPKRPQGVMAVAILWKQGAMREVSAWETEVEGHDEGDGKGVEGRIRTCG